MGDRHEAGSGVGQRMLLLLQLLTSKSIRRPIHSGGRRGVRTARNGRE